MKVNKISSQSLVRSEYSEGLLAACSRLMDSCFLLIVVVPVYSEEEEWSDEFDDFADERNPGFQSFP